jgi:hypothetical protein
MRPFTTFRLGIALAFFGLAAPWFAFAVSSVNLGTAENFVVLSRSGISNIGSSAVAGDVGANFSGGAVFSGFESALDASGQFATSAMVNGKLFASGFIVPTPATLVSATSDMETAYNDAMVRSFPTATGKAGGEIGGLNFTPGLYKWNTNVVINSDIILPGGAEDVWIFQVRENLSLGQGAKIILTDGALAKNVFWQVEGQTALAPQSVFAGNLLGQGAISADTGARIDGRVFSMAAVTLNTNVITRPGLPAFTPSPAVPATPTVPAVPASPAAPTNESLQAQVDVLLATVQALLAQAKSAGVSLSFETVPVVKPVSYFAQNLSLGSKGSDVSALQTFLIAKKSGTDAEKLSMTGVTGYFGILTQKALIEFQKNMGIMPASGYFGPKTRAHIDPF